MKKIGKEVLWSLIIGVAGSGLILFQTLAGNLADKTIIDFFCNYHDYPGSSAPRKWHAYGKKE